jgi:hypothetical protein
VRDVHISVEVEMRRSNGNYGWDQAMCQMSATLDQDEGVDDTASARYSTSPKCPGHGQRRARSDGQP